MLSDDVESPAFVFCADRIGSAAAMLREGLGEARLDLLYSVKACGVAPVLDTLRPIVDGFAVASPAEAQIVARFAHCEQTVHHTSPGLRQSWMDGLTGVTHLAFNSMSQWQRLRALAPATTSLGIRVNPGWSPIDDVRHDPARPHSKLGVRFDELLRQLRSKAVTGLQGIHVHNAYLCRSFAPLLSTVKRIKEELQPQPTQLQWINLGGGYVWDASTDFSPLSKAVRLLADECGLRVFFEPGAGLVRTAGTLVATVTDLFMSDGKPVAVLDTSVNHLPQVFEYQTSPTVAESVADGLHTYILAGCTCLAGDVFGEHTFADKLAIGSRVTFSDVGAYSLVKANMFNGIRLPNVYFRDASGEVVLVKKFSDEDYATFCGVGCQTKISPLLDTDKSPE